MSEQVKTELRPCPFCGKTHLEVLVSPTNSRKKYVRCDNDNCLYGAYFKMQDAFLGWNSRPIEDELQARIAGLEAENARLASLNAKSVSAMELDTCRSLNEALRQREVGFLKQIAELKRAAIVWHRYPEEKPKPNTRHLVVVNGNVHISRYDAEQDINKINVTHWAYLPAPPEILMSETAKLDNESPMSDNKTPEEAK